MGLAKIISNVFQPVRDSYYTWYNKSVRNYSFEGLEVKVWPEVFSPISNGSTQVMLHHLKDYDLFQKTFLELGCGSGIISVYAHSKGAIVTASDINPIALEELTLKSRAEDLNIISVYSDLFENLLFHFDYIIINPPFSAKKPSSFEERGTMCGENFEYFENLFSQLRRRGVQNAQVLLCLPDEAELFAISRRAGKHHFKLHSEKVHYHQGGRVVVYRVIEEE